MGYVQSDVVTRKWASYCDLTLPLQFAHKKPARLRKSRSCSAEHLRHVTARQCGMRRRKAHRFVTKAVKVITSSSFSRLSERRCECKCKCRYRAGRISLQPFTLRYWWQLCYPCTMAHTAFARHMPTQSQTLVRDLHHQTSWATGSRCMSWSPSTLQPLPHIATKRTGTQT